nr:hypothetical protein [Ferrovum sp.]
MQNKEDDSRIIKARTHTIAQGTYVIIESGAVNASYLVDSVESAAEDMMEHAKTLRDQAERALRRADLCKKAAGVLIRENTHQEESGEDSADAAIQSVGKVSADMIEKARGFLLNMPEECSFKIDLPDGGSLEIKQYGDEFWRNANGDLHRENAPAIERANGDKEWYQNGLRYREDGPSIDCVSGYRAWYRNGQLHREDGPAVERADGTVEYWINDGLHREDGPAVERADGRKEWWIKGELHREDGPAVEHANGDKIWFLHGDIHREDGPAFERADGRKEWWIKGELHREDGPAVEYANGDKIWFLHGDIHREDGPAVERADGTAEYWLNDERIEPPKASVAPKLR